MGDCWYAFIVGPPRGSSWLAAAHYIYHIKQNRFTSDPNQPLVQPVTKTVYVDIVPTFRDGTYRVGQDINPGVYHFVHTDDRTGICYWKRLRGFSGSLDDIIENGLVDSPRYVEIKASDLAFMSDGCGMWTRID